MEGINSIIYIKIFGFTAPLKGIMHLLLLVYYSLLTLYRT